MSQSKRRVPMFFKFLAGCVTLALLLVAGGSYVVHKRTGNLSRSANLEKNIEQYLLYQAERDHALATVADLLAQDAALRQALSTRDTADEVGEIAAARFARMGAEGRVQPDFLFVIDRAGRLVWQSPGVDISPDELSELGAGIRVRSGAVVQDKLGVHRRRAYRLAGVPVYAAPGDQTAPAAVGSDAAAGTAEGAAAASAVAAVATGNVGNDDMIADIVGGIVLGIDVNRYLRRYDEMRNTWRAGTYRLAVVADSRIVAATVAPERWPELSAALDKNNWYYVSDLARVHEGFTHRNRTQPATRYDGEQYTVGSAELARYRGMDAEPATLYLMRSQTLLERGGIPWPEVTIGMVLAIIIASVLAIWITRPIQRFEAQSKQILEGETDLTQRIELTSRDETRDLADNINQVFERLYELATEVQSAAFQVGASSAQISAASKQMASGFKDQTLKIEGSTAAVTELSASIQQVAANAAEATQVAEKSNESVGSAVTRMQEIREAVEDAAGKMSELGESSKRIGNIVEVIRQISEQTSLLALNASIEAAHAGEQGRGFAVVADEVSSLARRVGQSAKDIEHLIQTIREQTADAVQSMQAGSREVEGGTALVTNTLHDLTTLINVVRDTAGAVQEQAVVSDEIARNMDAVQTIAAEMLAGSDESVAQAEQLHELAFQLEQSVGGFNLDASHARVSAGGAGGAGVLSGRRVPRRLPEAGGRGRDFDRTDDYGGGARVGRRNSSSRGFDDTP